MKKFLVILLSILLIGGATTKLVLANTDLTKEIGAVTMDNLENVLYSADNIESIINNERNSLDKESTINTLKNMLDGFHEMPAFGVSLDSETRAALKYGTWIEFSYTSTHSYNDMPFDKLLIEVSPEWSGFNIFRYHDGKYEGRCFYINLNNTTMKPLYDHIHQIKEN